MEFDNKIKEYLRSKNFQLIKYLLETKIIRSNFENYALAISYYHLKNFIISRNLFLNLVKKDYEKIKCLNFLYYIESQNNNYKKKINYLINICKYDDFKVSLIVQLYNDLKSNKKYFYFEYFFKILLEKKKPSEPICKELVDIFLKINEFRIALRIIFYLIRKEKIKKIQFIEHINYIYQVFKKYLLINNHYNTYKKKENDPKNIIINSFLNKKNLIKKIDAIDTLPPNTWRFLTNPKDPNETDCLITKLQTIINNKKFLNNINNSAFVDLELSILFEKKKDYKTSSYFIDSFNSKLLKKTNNIEKFHERNEKEFEIFVDYYNQNKSFNRSSSNSKLIFIVGLPRSGSTLISQILASHSNTVSLGERGIFADIFKYFINVYQSDIYELLKFTPIDLINFKRLYLRNSLILNNKAIIDKMLTNFIQIPFLRVVFPNCKIIFTDRDYKDVAISIYRNFFDETGMDYANSLIDIVKYIKFYHKAKNYWLSKIDNIYSIKYEKLINNQEIETKKLLNYCDLNFESSCIEFYKLNNTVDTVSVNQVRKKIYTSSLGFWKNYEKFYSNYLNDLNLE
jgi:hypothetical protein